jgi:hypothetical protein
MIDPVFAGHAGETGGSLMMPHEILGALVLLAGLGVAILLVGLVALWLLVRIDRRLHASSTTSLASDKDSLPPRRPS